MMLSDHPASLNQQQHQAGDQHDAEGEVGALDGLRGTLAGLLRVGFDQLAEGRHLVFQLAERGIEGAQLFLRRIWIFQRQANDALGRADVGVEARFDLVQAGLEGVVDRQLEVFTQYFAKMPGMFLDGTVHLGLAAGAFAQAHQHRRQHIGAQGVVHHVGFKVIAQRGHADLVLIHRFSHLRVPHVTDQAHDQRGEQTGANQQQ